VWGLRCYVSNKLFREAAAAGSGTHGLRCNCVDPEEGGVGPGAHPAFGRGSQQRRLPDLSDKAEKCGTPEQK